MLSELSSVPAAPVELQRERFIAQRQHGRLALLTSRTARSRCLVAMVVARKLSTALSAQKEERERDLAQSFQD